MIGDGAISAAIGISHATAFQVATEQETQGLEAALQRTCLLGSFLNEALAGNIVMGADDTATTLMLSPGDLDETIMALVGAQGLMSEPGLIFEAVTALRIGTIEGFDACALDS